MKYVFAILFLSAAGLKAGENPVFQLKFKDGKVLPVRLEVPKDKKIEIEITNDGSSAEEFESVELNREKVILPGKTMRLFLGPLMAGEYQFCGDFHKDTAQGVLVAK